MPQNSNPDRIEKESVREILAKLPSISSLLSDPALVALADSIPSAVITLSLQQAVDEARSKIIEGELVEFDRAVKSKKLIARAIDMISQAGRPKLMRCINGAGVILHTGLGRAPLAPLAQMALREAAERYCLLALDRESGKRGDRHNHLDTLICELTGAESSLVVNNNAAAVFLVLSVFASGREVIISRGELVEIGGSFRIPDVMARSGARMLEVGTTNKTHLRDYESAITPDTSVCLKVHTSNYRIEGFSKSVSVAELSPLTKARGLLLIEDIGSGALVDLKKWNLPTEPIVPASIAAGADLVTFSGDKLVGGPQCGIIIGRRELIERLKKHPLVRALRPDKLTLAALDGTLRLFRDPDTLPENHPLYAMLTVSSATLNKRALRLTRRLKALMLLDIEILDSTTEIGSGALSARGLPTRVVSLATSLGSAEQFSRRLRLSTPPLFTRIENNRVKLDMRTLTDDEIRLIPRIIGEALVSLQANKS